MAVAQYLNGLTDDNVKSTSPRDEVASVPPRKTLITSTAS